MVHEKIQNTLGKSSMANMIFNTFEQAQSYANRLAQKLGLSVKFEKRDELWVVFDPNSSHQYECNPAPTPKQNIVREKSINGFSFDIEKYRKEQLMLDNAIQRTALQKAYRTACYICNGIGSINRNSCHKCMGRGFIVTRD